ncbi:mRNA interferase PemK [Bifidobacterium lemurum]|uniref:mRNA interferase n=1 Tax=Bifidobacterium lemurum TaxID=1603886 RepID=A0A261FLS3_9BIFI|nr:type II toxin-antitoxin system PemK/MazF family toxin [Bifidobacterium lemurum]OZG59776.1 mRNA interferase PemK [Bifidobacterium lemurum]QOL35062.1 type II toxin-antitoxin system PemK/MazF family toxin [Bifidobacterium lemurum]
MNGFRRGDVVAADLDPSSGHEQRKRRYLLVVSNESYNRVCNLTMVCPITSTDNGYPLHAEVHPISPDLKIEGFAQAEQLKALDLKSRNAQLVGYVPQDELDVVLELVMACLV